LLSAAFIASVKRSAPKELLAKLNLGEFTPDPKYELSDGPHKDMTCDDALKTAFKGVLKSLSDANIRFKVEDY